ncbi:MAG: hypothetical protein U7126_12030 [Microcoleus sp.]
MLPNENAPRRNRNKIGYDKKRTVLEAKTQFLKIITALLERSPETKFFNLTVRKSSGN